MTNNTELNINKTGYLEIKIEKVAEAILSCVEIKIEDKKILGTMHPDDVVYFSSDLLMAFIEKLASFFYSHEEKDADMRIMKFMSFEKIICPFIAKSILAKLVDEKKFAQAVKEAKENSKKNTFH